MNFFIKEKEKSQREYKKIGATTSHPSLVFHRGFQKSARPSGGAASRPTRQPNRHRAPSTSRGEDGSKVKRLPRTRNVRATENLRHGRCEHGHTAVCVSSACAPWERVNVTVQPPPEQDETGRAATVLSEAAAEEHGTLGRTGHEPCVLVIAGGVCVRLLFLWCPVVLVSCDRISD